jgi:hypothetical protein
MHGNGLKRGVYSFTAILPEAKCLWLFIDPLFVIYI